MREPAVARADKQRRGVLVPPQQGVGARAGKRLSDRQGAVRGLAPVGLQAQRRRHEELAAIRVERQLVRHRQAQHAPGGVDVAVSDQTQIAQPGRRAILVPRQRVGGRRRPAADANRVANAGFGAQRGIRGERDPASARHRFETAHAVADDAVDRERTGVVAGQGESKPRGARRFPGPPSGRIAENAGALAALHGGELVRAARRSGRAGKRASAGEVVVDRCLAPGEAESRHISGVLESAVDGQAGGQQIGLASVGLERHPGGRFIVAAAHRQGEVGNGFAGEDAKPQRQLLGLHLPSEVAVHRRLPAPPSRARSRRQRLARLHRHLREVDLGCVEGGRQVQQRLGGCHVVVGQGQARNRRPFESEVAAGVEGILGGDHDAVLHALAHRKGHRLLRQAGNQAEFVDTVADERGKAEVAAVHGECPVARRRRRPAMPGGGCKVVQRLASLRRCAEIAAVHRASGAIDARGELEVVVAWTPSGAPRQRKRHDDAAAAFCRILAEGEDSGRAGGGAQAGGENAQADAVVPAALRVERHAAARSAVQARQRRQRIAFARLEQIHLDLVREVVERARRDAEAEDASSRRLPCVPDRPRANARLGKHEVRQPVVDEAARVRRLARFRRGQQQVELLHASFAAQRGGGGEIIVGGNVRHGCRPGIGGADRDLHRRRSSACVPGRRGEVQAQVLRFVGASKQQPHLLLFADGHFADGDAVAGLAGQGAFQVVFAGCVAAPRQNLLDASAAARHARRVVGASAVDAQHRSGGHVAVGGHREIHGERLSGGRGHALLGDGNGELGRRRAADDRPGERGARGLQLGVLRHHLQAIRGRWRVAQNEPLHVVPAGARCRVAARRRLRFGAVRVAVHPQVQIVQQRLRQRVRRRFVPGHGDVQAACAFGHLDVLIAVFAVRKLQRRAAARPAVLGIPAQHAGARRHLAQAVLVLQCAWAIAGVQRELLGVVQKGVWPDGAGHEPGAHCGRLLAELRHRVHQQRGDASHRRRGHAGAAGLGVAAAGAAASGGDKPHAGANDLWPQAPIQRRAVTAETGEVAFPGRRAHRERVLRRGVVAATAEVRVASRHDVELPMPPDGGVELAFASGAPFPVQAVAA